MIPARLQTIIGLDVGTTGVKVASFGIGVPQRAFAIRHYPLLHPAPGQEVQDPDVIVAAATAALAECVASVGTAEVVGVSLSAAMHGLIALDDELRALSPLVTWADGRAAGVATDLAGRPGALDLQLATGLPVHPMTPMAKAAWFRRHDPATWGAARWWVGLKDYLIMWLTGTLATEVSSASGTGLLDVTTRDWSPRALALSGIEARQLPEIRATTDVLAMDRRVAAAAGLPAGTPVVVGAGDGPLANLGTGAIAPGVAGLSLGTSGAVRVAVDGPHPDPHGELFCYALTDKVWVTGGAISNGAEILRWADRAFDRDPAPGESSSFPVEDGPGPSAGSVAGSSDGLAMLPFLFPERAPLWDGDLAGAYLGLRHHHNAAHLRRAAIEGVCLQMRLLVDRVDRRYPITSVRATGGAFASPLWRDLMAAVLDRPMVVVGGEDGTALGAATLGLCAVGGAATLEAALDLLGGASTGQPVAAPPEQVAAFAELRHDITRLLHALIRTVGTDTAAGTEGEP